LFKQFTEDNALFAWGGGGKKSLKVVKTMP